MNRGTPVNTGRPRAVRGQPGRAFERDEPCFVYLAVHSAGQRFKIGLSNDPLRRFASLPEAEDIDLETTVARRMPTRARASQVERSLHRALEPYSLELAHQGDGYTEWFRLDAFATAVAIVDAMPDPTAPSQLLGISAKGARRKPVLIAAEHNVARAMSAAVLWREARRVVGLSITQGRGRVSLVVKDFRATASNAGSGLRARLLGLKDDYTLAGGSNAARCPCDRRPWFGSSPSKDRTSATFASICRTGPPCGACPGASGSFKGYATASSSFASSHGSLLTGASRCPSQEVEAGVGWLLEHRDDDPSDAPSLWG